MTYEQKCALLGIQRPDALVKGFKAEMPSVAISTEYGMHKMRVGARVEPKAGPDLSHLNPPTGKVRAKYTKRWWGKKTREERQQVNAVRFAPK